MDSQEWNMVNREINGNENWKKDYDMENGIREENG